METDCFWFELKETTRGRFLPPVSIAMSFIPIWKPFELMYMHRTRGKKIYSDHVTKTMHPSLLKVSVERYTPGHHGSLFCNLGAYLPPAHAVFFPLFIHYHVFLLFEFSHPINGLIAYFMFLDTLFLLRFDKQDKVPVV